MVCCASSSTCRCTVPVLPPARRRSLAVVEICAGIGGKLGSATRGTEMKGIAAILEPVLAGGGIDGHPADEIARDRSAIRMARATGVIVTSAAATSDICGFRVVSPRHRVLHLLHSRYPAAALRIRVPRLAPEQASRLHGAANSRRSQGDPWWIEAVTRVADLERRHIPQSFAGDGKNIAQQPDSQHQCLLNLHFLSHWPPGSNCVRLLLARACRFLGRLSFRTRFNPLDELKYILLVLFDRFLCQPF